jgi:anthranilate phosphoribosyltransferase
VWELDPVALGIPSHRRAELEVATLPEAVDAVLDVLAGKPGAKRDAVLLAAAASLVVTGIAGDWPTALAAAAGAIDSGESARILAELAETSRASA